MGKTNTTKEVSSETDQMRLVLLLYVAQLGERQDGNLTDLQIADLLSLLDSNSFDVCLEWMKRNELDTIVSKLRSGQPDSHPLP